MKKRIIFRQSKRLYLRPFLKSDLPYVLRWMNNPEVTQFLARRYPVTESEEIRWIEQAHERAPADQALMIVRKGGVPNKDQPIGVMGLHKVDLINRHATTGAAIGEPECWNKGYGQEAKMLLLEYAFEQLNLRQVYSHVMAGTASAVAINT